LYPRFGGPTRSPEGLHRAFFQGPTIDLWKYLFVDGYDDEQHRVLGIRPLILAVTILKFQVRPTKGVFGQLLMSLATPYQFQLTSTDGLQISCTRWNKSKPPRGIIQIAHGMGEHIGRYLGLIEALVFMPEDDMRCSTKPTAAKSGQTYCSGYRRKVSRLKFDAALTV
jgi:hypothetical protein